MTSRPLFLKFLLIDALASMFLAGLGVAYGGRLRGAAIVACVVIITVAISSALYALLIAWDVDEGNYEGTSPREELLSARWVYFSVWVCQIVGIMGTVFGFWVLLSSSDSAGLDDRIQEGGGVALAGTFVGVFCSLVLALQHRMIESEVAA